MPASVGHQPNKFHPPPIQPSPSARNLRPTDALSPTPACGARLDLHCGFFSQSAQPLAVRPAASPSQIILLAEPIFAVWPKPELPTRSRTASLVVAVHGCAVGNGGNFMMHVQGAGVQSSSNNTRLVKPHIFLLRRREAEPVSSLRSLEPSAL